MFTILPCIIPFLNGVVGGEKTLDSPMAARDHSAVLHGCTCVCVFVCVCVLWGMRVLRTGGPELIDIKIFPWKYR